MVELYYIVASAREVDTLVKTAYEEADYDNCHKDAYSYEACLACTEEVVTSACEHLAAERCGECEVLESLALGAEDVDEAGQIYGSEE